MVKSKIALIIDSFILSLLFSFLSFVWFRRYFKNANLFRFFLFLIILLSFIIIIKLFLKSNNKKILKNNNTKFLNSCLEHLIICPFLEYKNYLCKLLDCEHLGGYLFKFGDNFLYINIKTELCPNDYFISQEIFLNKQNKESRLYFIYKTKSKSFDEICNISNLNISLLEANILSQVMLKKNIFPIEKETIQKQSLKQKLIKSLKLKTLAISNKHFKELSFSGISLLFLSLIVPYSKLYLITGTILLTFSIITLFKKNYKPKNSDSEFLFK